MTENCLQNYCKGTSGFFGLKGSVFSWERRPLLEFNVILHLLYASHLKTAICSYWQLLQQCYLHRATTYCMCTLVLRSCWTQNVYKGFASWCPHAWTNKPLVLRFIGGGVSNPRRHELINAVCIHLETQNKIIMKHMAHCYQASVQVRQPCQPLQCTALCVLYNVQDAIHIVSYYKCRCFKLLLKIIMSCFLETILIKGKHIEFHLRNLRQLEHFFWEESPSLSSFQNSFSSWNMKSHCWFHPTR